MRPLEGVRVLDLSRILAGPFCSMKMGDAGADVVKVEMRGAGDDTRAWGPPFVEGESAYFLSVNRNKRSLTLDLKHPAAREIVEKLARVSDVVLSNFRPGTMEKLGLGYEQVAALNRRAVFATITGYGSGGSPRASYDVVIQAESGIMAVTGPADGEPCKAGISLADQVAGMLAFEGILLALLARERTGRGDHVDVALLDGMLAMLTYQGQSYFATGRDPARRGNQHPTIVPYQPFATADGWIVIGVASEGLWGAFCKVAGCEELAGQARFATNPDRVVNRDALLKILEPIVERRTAVEWQRALDAAGIPCGPIRKVSEALEDPEAARRGIVVEVDHPAAGTLRMVGDPVRLASSRTTYSPPPLVGEHTREILAELGYTSARIDELIAQGVV